MVGGSRCYNAKWEDMYKQCFCCIWFIDNVKYLLIKNNGVVSLIIVMDLCTAKSSDRSGLIHWRSGCRFDMASGLRSIFIAEAGLSMLPGISHCMSQALHCLSGQGMPSCLSYSLFMVALLCIGIFEQLSVGHAPGSNFCVFVKWQAYWTWLLSFCF